MCHSVLLVQCAVNPCGLASVDWCGIVDTTYNALFSKPTAACCVNTTQPALSQHWLAAPAHLGGRVVGREVANPAELPPWRLAQVAAASPNLPGTHERATIPLPATFSTDSHY